MVIQARSIKAAAILMLSKLGSGSNLCFVGRVSLSVTRQNRGTHVELRYANPTRALSKSTDLTHHRKLRCSVSFLSAFLHSFLFSSLLISTIYTEPTYAKTSDAEAITKIEQKVSNNSGTVNQAGGDINITQIIAGSGDFKTLQQRINDLQTEQQTIQKRISQYPNDSSFKQDLINKQKQLNQAKKALNDFKKAVLKLAQDIQKIPLNSKRLKQAVQYFEEGKFREARAILDKQKMTQDQDKLLAEQQHLKQHQKKISDALKNNAQEFILKAKLTMLDLTKPSQTRLKQAKELFKQALKSDNSVDNQFQYARFLQKNNFYKLAEDTYQNVLKIYRQLAKENPQVYKPDVAMTLNNLALIVAANNQRHVEAEKLYQEALKFYRQLAKENPQVYLPDVATTLNNLANLVSDNNQRRAEAEKLYKEALKIRRQLANDNPQVYKPYVAGTLNNLAILVADNNQRRAEAEKLYREALKTYRQLAKDNPQIYLPYVAGTLNNLANLVADNNQRRAEAEKLYQEALNIYRQLAKENPQVYLPDVAMTLNNLANLVKADNQRRAEAETLYREALKIYRQLAKENPQVYLPDVATTLNNLANLVQANNQRRAEAEKLYKEALKIHRQLAKDNPQVYLPDLATTLGAMGLAYLKWDNNKKALPLLKEATDILRPLAKQYPGIFGNKQAYFLLLLAQADSNQKNACNALKKGLEIVQDKGLKQDLEEVKKSVCVAE